MPRHAECCPTRHRTPGIRTTRMIAHTTLPVSDYKRSKAFYIKVLEPLGYRNNMEYGESAGFNDGKNTDFWITASTVTATHVDFDAQNSAHVHEFNKTAIAPEAE